jgi:hypothetical protein
MELLIKVAGNLERHAKALDHLADELEQSAPPPDTAASRAWAEEDVDKRIERLRHEAELARRAIKRVEASLAEHGEDEGGSEQAAA